MSLHDLIKEDAKKVFANPDDFAEPVVYYKRNGRSRKIDAVVVRDDSLQLQEASDLVTPRFTIYVANDEAEGIASDELDLGGDQIGLSSRVGEPIDRRSIVRLVDHDEGMLVLECR
jgi:hypothetical protein